MENAIEIRNLCKHYPSFTLDNVNITLPKGYIMGFIGANGRGKSTTISSLLGLVNPDSGTCLINGKSITQMTKAEKAQIGVVLDECNFPENLNYRQIDRFMKKLYTGWDSEKFLSQCKAYGLPEKTQCTNIPKV